MGIYQLEIVMKMWQQGTLTTEQAVGQILQHMAALSERIGKLEKQAASGKGGGNGR